MAVAYNTSVAAFKDLELYLDASNTKSYPGSGTAWNDLTGRYSFTLSNAAAWQGTGNAKYMDLGSYGCKNIPGGVLTDVTRYDNVTICLLTEVLASTANYRTLIRGAGDGTSGDHPVIIETGNNNIGKFDSDTLSFIDSGYDITSVPNYSTQMNFMAFKFSTASPYWEFFYNENLSTPVATITNANATNNHGFASLGGYHAASASPTVFDQPWGKIAVFMYYNRHLTEAELRQNYEAFRGRVGL